MSKVFAFASGSELNLVNNLIPANSEKEGTSSCPNVKRIYVPRFTMECLRRLNNISARGRSFTNSINAKGNFTKGVMRVKFSVFSDYGNRFKNSVT
ncbi:hypothetical protein PROFUN_08902 [Planoprotostelium fungivorum]|uniref:Uncharacterized protein n=1 Tax=Planoprotostelium fungivorum TaxID=1890364 RepID=A0A2P6NIV4_9EUKA|nr:hypothetical protein PROFUN_08902 [Planoprotostelium fungivorum]